MGDAALVAVPVIILVALATWMIIRGSGQTKTEVKTAKAVWKVGTMPDTDAVIIYLYKEVDGRQVERTTYARLPRASENFVDKLAALQGAAELEVSFMNVG